MKLVIAHSTVIPGGSIGERGQVIDTKVEDRKEDRGAHDLIAAGRAFKAGTPEADAVLKEVAAENEAKAEAAKEAKAAAKGK
jgi:hypothetical protein